MEIISIKNLSFKYPESDEFALENVSFNINKGDFVLICGESGCGKTTLMQLIKREMMPSGEMSGEILYGGEDISKLDERESASKIGYVMQNPKMQIVTDKVWHELAFGLENLSVPNELIRRRVAEMASYFGIQKWFRKSTSELSGGQMQLLNLASIMVMQPDVLILDEPTSQLDPIASADFIRTLSKINRELGLTVLMAEHRLEEVFPTADKVLVMEKGKAVLYDTPREVGRNIYNVSADNKIIAGLPSSVRIFNALGVGESCPLNVKEGREYISRYFGNEIASVREKEKKECGEVKLKLKDVWFRYEKNGDDILRGMNINIYKGEILSILGGNGTGKTTALRIMSGQKRAYRGKVILDGKKIEKYKQSQLYHENIALLPQNPQDVFLKSSLEEDLSEVTSAMGYSEEASEKAILEVTQRLGIDTLLKRHPYDLSGGEQQKAALAKVLLLKPKLLFLDEPTKGIDAYSKQVLGGILKNLQNDGLTIVIVTHDVEFSAEFSDRCAMFFDGEVMSAEEPNKFFSDNSFYTTAASRMSRHMYKNTVLCDDVIELCKMNGVIK